MHLPNSLTVPHWRSIVRHATPNIVEGKLLPTAVFLVALHWGGTRPAVIGALVFALTAIAVRLARKKRVPGLLWLTTLALTARTIAALAAGSLVVYFLQPTISTLLVGAGFLISALIKRPLVERLALDLFPIDEETRAHPVLRRFFRDVTLWWAFTSMVNFAITLWLLLSHSPTTFVLVKSVLGPVTTTVTLGAAFFWFRSLMARSGTTVILASPEAAIAT